MRLMMSAKLATLLLILQHSEAIPHQRESTISTISHGQLHETNGLLRNISTALLRFQKILLTMQRISLLRLSRECPNCAMNIEDQNLRDPNSASADPSLLLDHPLIGTLSNSKAAIEEKLRQSNADSLIIAGMIFIVFFNCFTVLVYVRYKMLGNNNNQTPQPQTRDAVNGSPQTTGATSASQTAISANNASSRLRLV